MTKRIVTSFIAAIAVPFAMLANANGAIAESESEVEARWASILERFVNAAGQVDFDGLLRDRADLDAYVAYIAEVSPERHPERFPTRQSRLAHYVNSYNALSMHGVLESDVPRSLGGLNKLWFFAVTDRDIGGESISLSSYENDRIRKIGEPRLHFALNCMSVGCPRLPREPFTASRIDEQLERETLRFLAEPRNLSIDHRSRTVMMSEIFDFYTEDFLEQAPSLIAYVNRYIDEKIPLDYAVSFIDYDWTVNRQPDS